MAITAEDAWWKDICAAFCLNGNAVSCKPYGSGHINMTYDVVTDRGARYILQQISTMAFADVPALMRNIELVTQFLQKEDPDPRHSLHLVRTRDGGTFLETTDGKYYRVYEFILDSLSMNLPESNEDFFQSACAFGSFQHNLSAFDASQLSETIPDFHNTPKRLNNLKAAVEADPCHRADECQEDIRFALDRESWCSRNMDCLAKGELPLRVTHNDTKLNNVLFDKKTRKAICVIDLDTVMPGLVANDFGDSIRFGANTALEDETDLTKVQLNLELYGVYTRGFLQACGSVLTGEELASLPWGAALMTYENGIRFLEDYLRGDVYFHISRPAQNLERARCQFTLLKDMEEHWQQMNEIVQEYQR